MKDRAIQKLEPPQEVKYKFRVLEQGNLPANPILRFIKIFFLGDGY